MRDEDNPTFTVRSLTPISRKNFTCGAWSLSIQGGSPPYVVTLSPGEYSNYHKFDRVDCKTRDHWGAHYRYVSICRIPTRPSNNVQVLSSKDRSVTRMSERLILKVVAGVEITCGVVLV